LNAGGNCFHLSIFLSSVPFIATAYRFHLTLHQSCFKSQERVPLLYTVHGPRGFFLGSFHCIDLTEQASYAKVGLRPWNMSTMLFHGVSGAEFLREAAGELGNGPSNKRCHIAVPDFACKPAGICDTRIHCYHETQPLRSQCSPR